ncbi:MAG: restriction endonuclease [Dehalococcoidia bacterium]|nr:MAG: restriction endonuclease [Dehalococcoidia bacterium]
MLDLVNYETKAKKAVKTFWVNRKKSGVLAGKNMDGFREIIKEIIEANGLPNAEVGINRKLLTLPGFFRPTKQWDMVVVNKGVLVAALEFKSQVGSFGNNFNNRAEEAIGSAVDLRTAYREGAFGKDAPKPFVGWFMLLEDSPKSKSGIKDDCAHFKIFPEFINASYSERYDILCHKLIQEQLYTSASVILSPSTASKTGNFSEMSELTGLKTFIANFAGHIAVEVARSQSKKKVK